MWVHKQNILWLLYAFTAVLDILSCYWLKIFAVLSHMTKMVYFQTADGVTSLSVYFLHNAWSSK